MQTVSLLVQHPAWMLYHTESWHPLGHPTTTAVLKTAIKQMQSSTENGNLMFSHISAESVLSAVCGQTMKLCT